MNEQVNTDKPLEYLKNQIKYLGFGESPQMHKQLENEIKSDKLQFSISTASEKTLPGNKMEYQLNFRKGDDKVFLNSFDATLTTNKNEVRTHNFNTQGKIQFTAKEALNLLEGRSVKKEFESNDNQKQESFIRLDLKGDKNEFGNYKTEFYNKEYGVDVEKIVSNSDFIFDKPEQKDYLIKALEKGNVASAKFKHNNEVIEGKAVLNPQYKNIQLYSERMQRLNTNKPIKGVEAESNAEIVRGKQEKQARKL